MTEKYNNRYRIASTRAAWWSYGWAGAYFITICTIHRHHFFGQIINNKMVLSSIGEMAHNFWYQIPNHANNVELGVFQVMPNHIHGILILNGTKTNTVTKTESDHDRLLYDKSISEFTNLQIDGPLVKKNNAVGPGPIPVSVPVPIPIPIPIPIVETRHALSLPGQEPGPQPRPQSQPQQGPQPQSQTKPQTPSQQRFQNQGKNTVSSIIGGYKSVVSKYAHQINPEFDWQSRFHDHIIRNDQEYQRINDYIETNPHKWHEDRFFMPVKPPDKGNVYE